MLQPYSSTSGAPATAFHGYGIASAAAPHEFALKPLVGSLGSHWTTIQQQCSGPAPTGAGHSPQRKSGLNYISFSPLVSLKRRKKHKYWVWFQMLESSNDIQQVVEISKILAARIIRKCLKQVSSGDLVSMDSSHGPKKKIIIIIDPHPLCLVLLKVSSW